MDAAAAAVANPREWAMGDVEVARAATGDEAEGEDARLEAEATAEAEAAQGDSVAEEEAAAGADIYSQASWGADCLANVPVLPIKPETDFT